MDKWVIFASILFINTIAAFMLALLVMGKRFAPGSRSIAFAFFALAIWTFSYALITLSASLESKIFWLKIENIGITTFAVFWFFFAVEYTRNEKWFPRLVRLALWIIPLVTLTLLFSGVWFGLYYKEVHPVEGANGPLVITRGFWYIFQSVQTYALLAFGAIMLLWHMFRLRDLYRRQIIFVLLGMAAPLLVNIFYQTGAKLFPSIYIPIDLTAIAFTITAGLISIGVFGLRMFDLIPIARNVVLENIPEMVIVIDAYNRVLDVNRAAQEWLDKPIQAIIGQDVMTLFALWSGLGARLQNVNDGPQEIELPGKPTRTLELVISPIHSDYGVLEGSVIVARDISTHKNLQNELKQANHALKSQLAEIEVLRARLQEQAIRDPLTGLYNRRYFAEALDREIARAEREGISVSVAALDLDYFKNYNDTYGHKCGDEVLICLAELLTNSTRRSDVVCRYGGEEFMVLMPGTDLETAFERIEEWRKVMDVTEIEINDQVLPMAKMSVGLACYPLHAKDGDSLLQAADKALYMSKSNGRDRLTVYRKNHSSES